MKNINKILRYLYLRIYQVLFGGVAFARYIGVSVGDNCRIYTTKFGTEPFLISIGSNVTLTSGVTFITHDGSGCLFEDEKGRRYNYSHIKIGNNVFVGLNSIIMPGVLIEDNVIIAAGSVVTKSIQMNTIVGGVPAKIIGDVGTFRNKVMEHWISEQEICKSSTFKIRINNISNKVYKEYIKK